MSRGVRKTDWIQGPFVALPHSAIDALNKHQKRLPGAVRKAVGKLPGEVSLEARWLLVTMAKAWNRKKPSEPFQYPTAELAREIGWSKSKVLEKQKELINIGILKKVSPGGLLHNPNTYSLDLDFMRVPQKKQ